jgi:hypothetical protein
MNARYLSRRAPYLGCAQRLTTSSLHQLHRLLQEWELIPRSSSITTSASAKPSPTSERRAIVTATEPESRAAYEQRPLPLLPGPPRASSSRRARECDRIPQPTHPTHLETAGRHRHRHRRVEGALGSAHAQEGSSPLEDYIMDAQTHEMIAIGLVQLRRHERAYL